MIPLRGYLFFVVAVAVELYAIHAQSCETVATIAIAQPVETECDYVVYEGFDMYTLREYRDGVCYYD